MPKFDCMNIASYDGPKPALNTCQSRLPLIAPMPVRTTSPLASTTSIPHCAAAWSP
jgi:hypothetical protein